MSTRTRPTTYTARLQRRPVRRRRRLPSLAQTTAALAVLAEAGHLAAAMVEWPWAQHLGLLHVAVGAFLGLLAIAVYFGHSRWVAIGGAVFVAAIPISWFAGLPLYEHYPLAGAVVVTVVELLAAALLARRGVSISV